MLCNRLWCQQLYSPVLYRLMERNFLHSYLLEVWRLLNQYCITINTEALLNIGDNVKNETKVKKNLSLEARDIAVLLDDFEYFSHTKLNSYSKQIIERPL